jgi:hypothetical protein
MVQVLSIKASCEISIPPTGVGGWFKSFLLKPAAKYQSRQRELADGSGPDYLSRSMNRSDLKYPPTAVSGIKTGL